MPMQKAIRWRSGMISFEIPWVVDERRISFNMWVVVLAQIEFHVQINKRL